MKKNTIAFCTLATFLVCAGMLYAQVGGKYQKQVGTQRARQTQDLDDVRVKIRTVEDDIKARNLKFRVAITDVMKYKISEIASTVPPSNMSVQASFQAQSAMSLLKKYYAQRYGDTSAKKKSSATSESSSGSSSSSESASSSDSSSRGSSSSDTSSSNRSSNGSSSADGPVSPFGSSSGETAVVPVTPRSPENASSYVEPNTADPNAAAFNWRDVSKMSPVKNQLGCGSCWDFTAMGVVEGCYLIQTRRYKRPF